MALYGVLYILINNHIYKNFEAPLLFKNKVIGKRVKMYCNLKDLISIIPEKELINLSNDKPADTINQETINTCMSFADELINASLRNKYSLPLSFVPDLVRQLSADITAYRVYSRRPKDVPEHIKQNYEFALKILANIQKGTTVLDLPSEHPEEDGVQGSSSMYITNKRPEDRRFPDKMWSSYAN